VSEHKNATDSARSFERRIREQSPGMDRSDAKKLAEKASRELHERLDKKR
jgi:hypothetical protein